MMSIAGLLALSLLGPAQADEADAPAFTYPEARRGDGEMRASTQS